MTDYTTDPRVSRYGDGYRAQRGEDTFYVLPVDVPRPARNAVSDGHHYIDWALSTGAHVDLKSCVISDDPNRLLHIVLGSEQATVAA